MTLQPFQVCDRDLTSDQLQAYLQTDRLAVDTETMGLQPHRDRLCLVQLCNAGEQITVIRIERGQTQAPNLQQLMEADSVQKVFHFARFDIAALKFNLGIQTQPVFCTKIASKLIRTYSSRHGLKELVRELEGVDLDKTAQSSDWGNPNNLSEDQLSYAANDVRYLLPVEAKLIAMLKREERWDLAQSCIQCLPTLVALDLMLYDNVFEH
jgi:ribonuclease D